jgi:serine/threonine protein kinase
MNRTLPPDLFASSTEIQQMVDEVCDRFEEAWWNASRPSIEHFVDAANAKIRSALLGELVVLEVQLRQNAGERPAMSDYTRRFPEDRSLIRWVLLEHVAPFPGSVQLEDFGPYRILRRIETGGMGIVFKAQDLRTGRLVAFKVLTPALTREDAAVRQFEREIELAGRIQHPNLATLLDAGETDGLRFLVTEYIEGFNLKQLVRRHGELGVAEGAELIKQAAEALESIHALGVVHRDVKPSNLLLSNHGAVVVLDWGLARAAGLVPKEDRLEEEGAMLGTFDYMAPEQWDNPECADERSDVYSLGCTLYHLLTGSAPFSGLEHETLHQKRTGHQEEDPPSLANLRPDVPEHLRWVLERVLAKDPTARFRSASEVADALEPFARGADLQALLKRTQQGLTQEDN